MVESCYTMYIQFKNLPGAIGGSKSEKSSQYSEHESDKEAVGFKE